VVVAGDIADDGSGDSATSDLVVGLDPDVALTTGDNAYPDGALSDYQSYYAPTWGRFRAKTRPVPGNHEYHTAGAAGYFDYFNGAGVSDGPAGVRGRGYYSFDVGAWHLIALNNYVSMSAGSAQEQWLRQDLAANSGQCTLAYWHEPRFTSGAEHTNNTATGPLWQALYAAGADVVLNGHNHQYERFAPQDPNGSADPANGIREFVVGTGGAGLYAFATPQPNSEVRNATANGVLELTLHQDSYAWSFKPVAGATFTDSGSSTCHAAGTPTSSPTPTPTPTPTATPVAGQYPLRGMFFRQSNGGYDVIASKGFNLIDSTPNEVADLPAGLKGLTWVGDYDRTTCSFQQSDTQIRSAVQAHIGDPKIGVWFISDEPWQGGTPNCANAPAQHKARSDLIHSIDPNAKTLIVLDGNSDHQSIDQIPSWKGTADYIGINAYICWQGQSSCQYQWIDQLGAKFAANNVPLWGVLQAHGEPDGQGQTMCVVTTAGGTACGQTRLPTPAEIHQQFLHWRATTMLNYLVFSWRWPDNAPSFWLQNQPTLQDQLKIENG
jgi:hypothetical protein